MKKLRKKHKGLKIFLLVGLSLIIIVGAGVFAFSDIFTKKTMFKTGSRINGIDVSGLTGAEAKSLVLEKLETTKNKLNIELVHGNKKWTLTGKDFNIDDELMPTIENMFNYFNSGNLIQRKNKLSKLKDGTFNISYCSLLVGLENKIEQIASEIEQPVINAELSFNANLKNPFTYKSEQNGVCVNSAELMQQIETSLQNSFSVNVEIPITTIHPEVTVYDLKQHTALKSKYSTNYQRSKSGRKHNIKCALAKFNGMIVSPEQEVSFNNTTGSRTLQNGYKKANILLNGVYVEGVGGGVCQASTTLYNAVVMADLKISEVNKHTLPASYVPIGYDAMVNEGTADLKFINTTSYPIYIKAWGDENTVNVEIYGAPFKDGERLERRTEFVKAIPHQGDKILSDIKGEYSNKVTFKGEYYRLKYPKEGYQSKVYLVRYKNDVVVEEKLIRDVTYPPQQGIIIEGVEELFDGITLPNNKVKYISPQRESKTNSGNLKNKLEKENPSDLNP